MRSWFCFQLFDLNLCQVLLHNRWQEMLEGNERREECSQYVEGFLPSCLLLNLCLLSSWRSLLHLESPRGGETQLSSGEKHWGPETGDPDMGGVFEGTFSSQFWHEATYCGCNSSVAPGKQISISWSLVCECWTISLAVTSCQTPSRTDCSLCLEFLF